LEKRTIISIITAANIKIRTITVTITALISLYTINYVALYTTRKAADYKTTPKKNKKNLKLNLGLLIETSLANLMTDLINNSINISWIMKMMILTQKKNLRKLFKH
jgi:hypothetical protein